MRETWTLSWHIVRRNWWVYRKDFLANIAPTVTDPVFFLLSLGLGLGAFITQIEGRSYAQFLAPGLAGSTAMFTAFFETSYGFFVRMNFEYIFKAMLTTPIGPREIVIGELIWVGLKGALMVTGVSLVLAIFGLFHNPMLILLMPFVGFLTALPLGCVGLLSSCYVSNINQFQTCYAFIISPLYFFSGIFFPVEQMPFAFQVTAKILPLYHGVKLSQAVFWSEHLASAWLNHAPVLLLYSIVLFAWTSRAVYRQLYT